MVHFSYYTSKKRKDIGLSFVLWHYITPMVVYSCTFVLFHTYANTLHSCSSEHPDIYRLTSTGSSAFMMASVRCSIPVSAHSSSEMSSNPKKSPYIFTSLIRPPEMDSPTSTSPKSNLTLFVKSYAGEDPKFQAHVEYLSLASVLICSSSSSENL